MFQRVESGWGPVFKVVLEYCKRCSEFSRGFCSKVKIVTAQLFATPPYFCWQLAFYRHLPTSTGKTRSKRPRSHCLSTGHLLPYMWSSFHPLDPSRYLSSFSSILPPSSLIQRLLLGWHRRIQYSRLAKTLLVLQPPPAKLAFRSPWWSWVDTLLRHFKTFMAEIGHGICCTQQFPCKGEGFKKPPPKCTCTDHPTPIHESIKMKRLRWRK